MAWVQLDIYGIYQKQENIKQWLGYNWISLSMVSTKNRKILSNGLGTTGYLWYPPKTGKYKAMAWLQLDNYGNQA